jgi:hypothetical protein
VMISTVPSGIHLNPDLKHRFKVIERPRFARRGWPDANAFNGSAVPDPERGTR